VDSRTATTLVAAQVAGGAVGAVLANLMFDLDAVSVASTDRSSPSLWLAEVVATLGLVVVVFGTLRSASTSNVAFAVGAYIGAAYWFTSSTSFANPAVTAARTLSDTFAGIAPSSALPFAAAQLVGGALGWLAVGVLFPAHEEVPA
jgi:arsenate reductase